MNLYLRWICGLLAAISLGATAPAEAIPYFARKKNNLATNIEASIVFCDSRPSRVRVDGASAGAQRR
jgi:hypothetical protein